MQVIDGKNSFKRANQEIVRQLRISKSRKVLPLLHEVTNKEIALVGLRRGVAGGN